MSIMNFFVLNSAQRTISMSFNDGNTNIDPRAIDNTSPGVGLNLNDNSTDYEPGEPVTLSGCFVAPKRIVDDPAYIAGVPDMITFLLTLPWCSLETETIFAPEIDEE